MKLSAVVLLSVNFVAASQVAANAADTASFLQEALTARPQQDKSAAVAGTGRARPAQNKKRGQKSYVAMTPVLDGVKIRPFMPGRYLPSQADLEAKRQAEAEARQVAYVPAADADAVLTGQVSAHNDLASSIAPVAAYAMSRPCNQAYVQKAIQKVKQAAKNFSATHARSIPGVNPVMPGQVTQSPALATVPEPRTASFPLQVPQPPSLRTAVPKVPNYVAAGSPVVVPPPALTKYESSQLERLVEDNLPENVYGGFNGDMRATGQGNPGLAGAGPPPFPLSSMPMNNVRPARGVPAIGSQARFGSWHGGHSNLPQASFQSYVPIHTAGPMSINVHHFKGSHKTGRQAANVHQHKQIASSLPAAKSKTGQQKKPQTQAASYAPYRRYTGLYL